MYPSELIRLSASESRLEAAASIIRSSVKLDLLVASALNCPKAGGVHSRTTAVGSELASESADIAAAGLWFSTGACANAVRLPAPALKMQIPTHCNFFILF